VAISPDGALLATGTHNPLKDTDGIKLWETQTGRFIKQISVGGIAEAVFSPDGRWLAVRGEDRALILTVGDCKERARGRWGAQAFSPDSRLLAVETGTGVIRLLDAGTGREKARLEDPNQDRAGPSFSPDGTRLIAVSEHGKASHVWNLRLIRQELDKLDLDWDEPPYPAAGPANEDKPLHITVVGTELVGNPIAMLQYELDTYSLGLLANPFDADLYVQRGRVYAQMKSPKGALRELNFALALAPEHPRARFLRGTVRVQLGRWPQARDDFDWLIERTPHDPELYLWRAACRTALSDYAGAAADYGEWLKHGDLDANTLNAAAWKLVGRPADRPAAQVGAADLALPLIEKAVAQAPTDLNIAHTQGVTYYRLERYRDAIAAFERLTMQAGKQLRAFELYFLAMCHHKLGEEATAKREFEQAVRWQEQAKVPPAQIEDLQSFRAEAEAVLGIPRTPATERQAASLHGLQS
jgi:tetratricopeptide (TPR) repeat protein